MNPDQLAPVEPRTPAYQPASAVRTPRRKITGIWLLVGPTVLLIFSIAAYAIANFAFNSSLSMDGGSGELFGQQSIAITITNIALFITGTIGVIAWLPGIIIGIVLLTTQKQ